MYISYLQLYYTVVVLEFSAIQVLLMSITQAAIIISMFNPPMCKRIHTLYTYTLLMLPKWAFQLNRIKKYKYIN